MSTKVYMGEGGSKSKKKTGLRSLWMAPKGDRKEENWKGAIHKLRRPVFGLFEPTLPHVDFCRHLHDPSFDLHRFFMNPPIFQKIFAIYFGNFFKGNFCKYLMCQKNFDSSICESFMDSTIGNSTYKDLL